MKMQTQIAIIIGLLVFEMWAGVVALAAEQTPGDASGVAFKPVFDKVLIAGEDHKNGIFDPSVEYGADGIGWMTYSKVEWPARVSIHLARSNDHGKTWTHVQDLFESASDELMVEGETREVVWRYETSSLLYDPEDEPGRQWKVFAQRLFSTPPHGAKNSYWSRGWIEYRHAASPEEQWSATERLFGSQDNNCRVNLSALHPDLERMLWYNEIGSIVEDGVIYLSMDGSPTPSGLGDWENRKVVLFASKDHGGTWEYIGTLTDYAAARAFGYLIFTATSLVRENDRLFLVATPAGALEGERKGHDGTYVVEFEDIARGKLERDDDGKLIVLKKLEVYLTSGGQSDYDEQNTYGGIMFSQIDAAARPDFFQVFATKERIVAP